METPSKVPQRLLLAIPAYREADRLPPFLRALLSQLEQRLPEARVVVCDDGSGAVHAEKLRRALALIQSPSLLPPLFLAQNVGKGGAVLAAWDREPGYDAYAFVDADGAVPPHEVVRLAEMSDGDAALFGSRVRMLGRRVDRSLLRHLMGRVFNEMVELAIEPRVYDSQCGLKLIPASALRSIRPWLQGRRFAFDVELIAALRVVGVEAREVPIDWQHIHGSKVHFVRDTVRMIRSVLEIRRDMAEWSRATPTR